MNTLVRVGRVTPCAPANRGARRRARSDTPYLVRLTQPAFTDRFIAHLDTAALPLSPSSPRQSPTEAGQGERDQGRGVLLLSELSLPRGWWERRPVFVFSP